MNVRRACFGAGTLIACDAQSHVNEKKNGMQQSIDPFQHFYQYRFIECRPGVNSIDIFIIGICIGR